MGHLSIPALPIIVVSLAFKSNNLIKVLVSGSEVPFTYPSRIGLPSPRIKAWWSGIRERVRNFGESGSQGIDIPLIFQGDLTLKLSANAKPSAIKRNFLCFPYKFSYLKLSLFSLPFMPYLHNFLVNAIMRSNVVVFFLNNLQDVFSVYLYYLC